MRVALVTGASSGLGEATARRLAREPRMRLALLARRGERLERLAAELPVPATVLALDLTDEDAPGRARAHLEEHHGGRLDLLVNNAGAGGRGAFSETGYAMVRRTMTPELRRAGPARRGAAAAAARLRPERDRQRRQHVRAHRAGGRRRLLGVQGRARRLERQPARRGARARRPRRHRDARLHPDRGVPAARARREAHDALAAGTPEQAADAIVEAGLGRRAERYVPRFYGGLAGLRTVAPGLVRRVLASKRADILATRTSDR